MANIGIIGHGFVGKAVVYGFKDHSQIKIFDKFQESDSIEEVVKHSEFIFICLPTPFKGEHIDLSIIDENLEKIAPLATGTDKIIVIKSTVVPGTTKMYAEKYPGLNICANPEFLTEKAYLDDFVNADRHIVGSEDPEVGKRLVDLYKNRFPETPVFLTNLTAAEMVKYMSNTFLATKVTFANEMFQLAEKLGIDYHEVKKLVTTDRRIFDSHLDVTEMKGFGGKCFPKDLVALIGHYKDLDLEPQLLEAVWSKNLKVRTAKDWEDIPFVKSD